MKPIVDRKSRQSTVVVVEGLKGQENVWLSNSDELDVRSVSGFSLGTVTTVSLNNGLEETANNVLLK